METKIETKIEKKPLEKVCLICAKGSLEDVYASLVMANGAVMEGIETNIFFTFFGLEGITKKAMNHLHTATTGNPAMRMPGGLPFPTMLGGLPGMEAFATKMMKSEMEKLDIPPVGEFLEILSASGTKLWACKLAMDMFHLDESKLIDDLDGVLTVGDFYARGAGDSTQLMFI